MNFFSVCQTFRRFTTTNKQINERKACKFGVERGIINSFQLVFSQDQAIQPQPCWVDTVDFSNRFRSKRLNSYEQLLRELQSRNIITYMLFQPFQPGLGTVEKVALPNQLKRVFLQQNTKKPNQSNMTLKTNLMHSVSFQLFGLIEQATNNGNLARLIHPLRQLLTTLRKIFNWRTVLLLNSAPPPGGGHSPIWVIQVCAAPKGMVFRLFGH